MMSARSFLVSRHSQSQTQPQNQQRPSRPISSVSPVHPSRGSVSSTKQFSTPTTSKDEYTPKDTTSIATTITYIPDSKMPSRWKEADSSRSPTPSPPRTTTTITRPNTPSSPVQIPRHKPHEPARLHRQHRHHSDRRHHSSPTRPKDVHSPEAIPPSVAALLAVTSIPPPRSSRSLKNRSARDKRMTVESFIERSQESEKELSLTLSRGPLDLLLTAPEDLEDDDLSFCGSNMGSTLSTRTVSVESMPSLMESFTTETVSSLDTPRTPYTSRKIRPTRRSLEPVSSPQGEQDDHPLSSPEIVDESEFRPFEDSPEAEDKKSYRLQFKPLKVAFKSNLTASLRALRQAARSFSSLNFSSIPPEDFLTRSLLTLDPQVPYTDERRPPPLEEEPTAALRRYLNPTTTVRLEKTENPIVGSTTRTFTASIQMQTYKVQRARSSSSGSGRGGYPSTGPTSTSQASQNSQQKPLVTEYPVPGPRQREMRENSDFIRIAVMEMAMRKRGKLDDQRPGRARWALPPRKTSAKPYEVGPDGVPARWVAVTY